MKHISRDLAIVRDGLRCRSARAVGKAAGPRSSRMLQPTTLSFPITPISYLYSYMRSPLLIYQILDITD